MTQDLHPIAKCMVDAGLSRKPKQNPPKDDCRCGAFCIEDTASTGRVCKLEKHRARAAIARARGDQS